jgi:3-hydroxymyristoyl/3-hydroxydecanoyl-(acyl carrier protein) dehydratase
MSILAFEVSCALGDESIYELTTAFGFFPGAALANQIGLPTSDDERAWRERPSEATLDAGRLYDRFACLPRPMLRMLDRVSGYWPNAGAAGLGRLRAEKDVRADEWFFKAHFFSDPVQPGSLGIEAMLLLLKLWMLEQGMADGIAAPRFEPIALGTPLTWKYRGQVLPSDARVTVELEITRTGDDARGRFAIAEAWLWVDDRRIYHARELGCTIVSGAE